MEREQVEVVCLVEAIRLRYGYDLSGYAEASLARRLECVRKEWRLASLSQVQDVVLSGEERLHAFLSRLTVTTSEMFRDPAFFLALRESVVPTLRTFPSLNIWVAGCSTGEELWSLAILLHEEGLLERTTLHATDINRAALKTAAQGIYSALHAQDWSTSYRNAGGKATLRDYVTVAYEALRVPAWLHSHVVFSEHNLVTDGVFCECHLILCRNVLIYFRKPLQDRVIGLFGDALRAGGYLGLGGKESLKFLPSEARFQSVDANARLYRKGVVHGR